MPWTTINYNGLLARVSSGVADIPGPYDIYNPIGALAAGYLGIWGVFKRLIRLKDERGTMLNGFTFSLRNYSESPSDYGPTIPESLPYDLLAVGAGAIGNGIIHLISRLPFTGTISIVDREEYGSENLGTCILMTSDDSEKLKAARLASMLTTCGIRVNGFGFSPSR